MKTADLHLHTFYSDGSDSPERVVELAHAAGLSSMAITDHDNTEAFAIAQPVAQRLGIELLTGIEMSASTEGAEVHMLGHLIDRNNGPLKEHLRIQQARRVERVKEMVAKLRTVGVTIEAEEVLALAEQGTVGRPHVAKILMKHGYIKEVPEAFQKYIGTKNPGFVPGSPMAPGTVIQLIRRAGGVPVLAHPIFLENDALIEQFVADGLVGLEVYHSSHNQEQILHYERLADRLKLLKTGGSDYHGIPKEGLPVGAVKVPYELVEKLKAWTTQSTRA